MTADDYNYLLPTILDSWLETRIKVKDSLKDRVSVNQTKVDEAVRQLVSFSDRITDHLHNSDGPDDHKIAWSFVLAVYHFELLDFDRTVTEKQRVSIVDDCAMTILCAVLNIDQDKIRSELKTVDALYSLMRKSKQVPFFVGSFMVFLLQKSYPLIDEQSQD